MAHQKITPCLWFDTQAEEAARFYTTLLPDSSVDRIARYNKAAAEASGQPEGSVLTVDFTLSGFRFVALNGGPVFEPNPSISFHINCESKEMVDGLWTVLSDGGEVLMPLGEYPFSERFGWCNDRYGVSWQLIFTGGETGQRITPVLLFVGDVCGLAEGAVELYASVFENSRADILARYGPGEPPDKEGTVKYASFTLEGLEFGAMDSAHDHDFAFNEAVSFIVKCDDQEEIDYFWNKLTADGGEESMCGWLKDRFGLSWQIVPGRLVEMITSSSGEKASRAMEAMLGMKKLDIATLEDALGG